MPLIDEILSIRFPEDTLVIGPRAALGSHGDVTESGEWVATRLNRIRHDPDALARLRRFARRWHIVGDIEAASDTSMIDRVALATRGGRLTAIRAPRSGAISAGRIDLAATADRVREAQVRTSPQPGHRPGVPGVPVPGLPGAPPSGGLSARPVLPRINVAALSIEGRLVDILHRTVESRRLSAEAAVQLRAMISPEQIATTVAVLAAWVASQFLGIGLVFDILMLGMGIFMLGQGAVDAARHLLRFFQCVSKATSERDLDEAADLLAAVIVAVGISVLRAAIRRGVGKTTGAGGEKGGKGAAPPRLASSSKELQATPLPRERVQPSVPPVSKEGQKLLPGRVAGEQKLLPAPVRSPAPPVIDPSRYDRPPLASMSNEEARRWYHAQEDRIPAIIEKTAPLETQAKQAHAFRNEIRTAARDAMKDQEAADKLHRESPNKSWDQLVGEKHAAGYEGDGLYKAIIESSKKSRPDVDAALGIVRTKP